MSTLAELLLAHGIRPRTHGDGDQKLACPRCSHTRRKRSDPCLSLAIDGDRAVWHCHHCGWSGAVNERERKSTRRQNARPATPIRPTKAPDQATAAVLAWLAKRGVSEATIQRNRVGVSREYIPELRAKVDCIAFPYFRDGELVNIKYRALAEKAFAQVKGAEKILYGLDDIADTKSAIRSGDPAACTLLRGGGSSAPIAEVYWEHPAPVAPRTVSGYRRQQDLERLMAEAIATRRRG